METKGDPSIDPNQRGGVFATFHPLVTIMAAHIKDDQSISIRLRWVRENNLTLVAPGYLEEFLTLVKGIGQPNEGMYHQLQRIIHFSLICQNALLRTSGD
ncbi:hypothetical protein CDAR_557841 [Caerostris darwini]|uniref:Uncharacterized protein n=1 Tax=Caerostris darwini TaxID=1538125 RepID=A0AAV4REZ1_9ARAC|nr:hypothetical protein CDAR_557841 [Caerostris darwini]